MCVLLQSHCLRAWEETWSCLHWHIRLSSHCVRMICLYLFYGRTQIDLSFSPVNFEMHHPASNFLTCAHKHSQRILLLHTLLWPSHNPTYPNPAFFPPDLSPRSSVPPTRWRSCAFISLSGSPEMGPISCPTRQPCRVLGLGLLPTGQLITTIFKFHEHMLDSASKFLCGDLISQLSLLPF